MSVPVWLKRGCITAPNRVTRILYNGRSLGTPSNANKLTIYWRTNLQRKNLQPILTLGRRLIDENHARVFNVLIRHVARGRRAFDVKEYIPFDFNLTVHH